MKKMIGRLLANYLAKPHSGPLSVGTSPPDRLLATIRKGDVLLVEGNSRFSVAIKYLTQSSWSHSALCIGEISGNKMLVEADILEGVRLVPVSRYLESHTRICRPVRLSPEHIEAAVEHAVARVGQHYDLDNIVDLVRYLIQRPPVPEHWRRRMLAFGGGEPTRAICSSLIAQAFHSVGYPILPKLIVDNPLHSRHADILHIQSSNLFTPRDFDISPYFSIVKPSLEPFPLPLASIGDSQPLPQPTLLATDPQPSLAAASARRPASELS